MEAPRGTRTPSSDAARSDARRVRHARRRLWLVGAAVLLLFGLAGSAFGGLAWYHSQRSQDQKSFADNAVSAAAAVGSSLRRDLDFIAAQQALIVTFPSLTNRELATWYQSVDVRKKFPAAIAVGFVEPVTAAELPAFLAELAADPPVGRTTVADAPVPPGARAEYCIGRFGILLSPIVPATEDVCAPFFTAKIRSPFPAALTTATDTGRTVVAAAWRLVGKAFEPFIGKKEAAEVSALFAIVVPVYRTAQTPATIAGRQSAIEGWMVGDLSSTTLLSSALGSTDLGVALQFRSPDG